MTNILTFMDRYRIFEHKIIMKISSALKLQSIIQILYNLILTHCFKKKISSDKFNKVHLTIRSGRGILTFESMISQLYARLSSICRTSKHLVKKQIQMRFLLVIYYYPEYRIHSKNACPSTEHESLQ